MLKLLTQKKHIAVTCDWTICEARRNIEIQKPDQLNLWVTRVEKFQNTKSSTVDNTLKVEDCYRPSISAAIQAKCSYYLTADHWLIRNHGSTLLRKVKIVSLETLTREMLGIGQYLETNKIGSITTVTYAFSNTKRNKKLKQ